MEIKVKSHKIITPIFYLLFGLFFSLFALVAVSRIDSFNFQTNTGYWLVFFLVAFLLGPVPFCVGAWRVFLFFKWGQPTLTFDKAPAIGDSLSGKIELKSDSISSQTLEAHLSCRRVRKTFLPLDGWRGLTPMYGDEILWSKSLPIDSDLKFQISLPKDLPPTDSPDENPTFGNFWFLELRFRSGLPAKFYFTIPVRSGT